MEFGGAGIKKILSFILEDWKLLLLLTIIFALYFYYTSTFDHFENLGIPYIKPTILVGNSGPRFMGKESFHEFQLRIYNNFKGKPYGGIFEGRKPIYYVMDPELIKRVLISDFNHFEDRNVLMSREPTYVRRALNNLPGAEWKKVRSAITPIFSPSRLKNMLPLVQMCAEQMVTFLKQYDKKDVEMKGTLGHFTLEVVGACAFGMKTDALSGENSHFVKMAIKYNYVPELKRLFLVMIVILMPKLMKTLHLSFLNHDVTDELVKILNVVKAERRSSGIKKNDFLQLLLDAVVKDDPEGVGTESSKHFTDDTIDGQALLFLLAGYETSSTLLSFAAHTLACNPHLQDKLREHIVEMTDGKEITYDLLAQMSYLEAFLLETLRIYPPLSRLNRVVTSPCSLPGTTIPLRMGDYLAVSVYGLHMDPDIYPHPAAFRPERFLGDEKNERPSHLFLPFGTGPRSCVGPRFAITSSKLAMVYLLKNFKFSKCEKTVDPPVFEMGTVLLKPQGGLWVRVDAL